MTNIWIISDTHFNDEKIIAPFSRPFANAKQANECMIENWNSIIKADDEVWHLGDVYAGPAIDAELILRSLKGRKKLLLGNHDRGKDALLQSVFEEIEMWKAFPDLGILMTHVPVDVSVLGKGPFKGKPCVNVHGHIHSRPAPTDHHRCVCVEHTGYKPINIEELREK